MNILHRAIGADEWVAVIGPDERTTKSSAIIVRTCELKSYKKFLMAVVERSWPPRVPSRAQWRTLLEQLTQRNRG
jgi:hypothetical protein